MACGCFSTTACGTQNSSVFVEGKQQELSDYLFEWLTQPADAKDLS